MKLALRFLSLGLFALLVAPLGGNHIQIASTSVSPTQTPTTIASTVDPIGDWTTTTSLPQAFGHAPAVVYNRRIYLAGGEGPGGSIRTSVYYSTFQADGSLSTWSTTIALPRPRHYHAMVAANGYLYQIGGSDGLVWQSTIYYARINADGSLGAWSTNSLPAALGAPSAVIIGERLYILDLIGNSV